MTPWPWSSSAGSSKPLKPSTTFPSPPLGAPSESPVSQTGLGIYLLHCRLIQVLLPCPTPGVYPRPSRASPVRPRRQTAPNCRRSRLVPGVHPPHRRSQPSLTSRAAPPLSLSNH